MAWRNRQALDWMLAETGGICYMYGDQCCAHIPNNTAFGGTFYVAMSKIRELRQTGTEIILGRKKAHGTHSKTWKMVSFIGKNRNNRIGSTKQMNLATNEKEWQLSELMK